MKNNPKLAPLTEEVFSSDGSGRKVPKLFNLCSGAIVPSKVKIMNSVLVNHVITIKKKDGTDYQANTLVTHLKMIFSNFHCEGITMKLARNF